MTPELIELVKRSEGFRAHAYLCPAGYPTQGYGHRVKSLNVKPVTEELATTWLHVDLATAETLALKLAPNLATEPNRLAALTDLTYNVGLGALDGANPDDPIDDAGVVRALRRGDWVDAARRFQQWVNARDPRTGKLVKLPGLVTRRAVGASWILHGG